MAARFPARRIRSDPCRQRAAEPGRHDPVLENVRRAPGQGAGERRGQAAVGGTEQFLGRDRQPSGAQDLPQAGARRATRHRDRPLPGREGALANTPPLLGAIERAGADGQTTALAAAFGFVRNQGDGWVYTVEYLQRTLDQLRLVAPPGTPSAALAHEPHVFYLAQARVLGQRTAELHRALATPTDDAAFAAEPITRADLRAWQRRCATRPKRRSRRCDRLCRSSRAPIGSRPRWSWHGATPAMRASMR